MSEYIERESVLNEIERREALMVGDKRISVDALRSFIKNRPAYVAPVVHGQWDILDGDKTRMACSVCGWDVPEYDKFYSYCPNCGAKMDGGN